MNYRARIAGIFRPIAFLLAITAIIAALLLAVNRLEGGEREEGRKRLDTAVRRAAASCYAIEGMYPPSLEYLETHYGLQVDRERYTVHYEIFAENIMPDITTLENGD